MLVAIKVFHTAAEHRWLMQLYFLHVFCLTRIGLEMLQARIILQLPRIESPTKPSHDHMDAFHWLAIVNILVRIVKTLEPMDACL